MSRYITLGADENGEVYGLEVNDDGTWRRNSLGYATNCVVIRPVTKKDYEYRTEDPESAEDLWKAAVAAGQTRKGLDDWFKNLDPEEFMDKSFVFDLLDANDNLTVEAWHCANQMFREHVEEWLIESAEVPDIESKDDVYEWEASGCFPPRKPFAVELAPKAVLEEYYAHLRETSKEFVG